MNMMNLLAGDVALPVFGQTFGVSLNWIGNLIRLLISGVGVVGVGVILFSLILKGITLPLDIYQRVSMRKQNNRMKENKERMEKLKKQYANDEKMYNQKVLEMQREGGFSVLSACLPMIVSLVIFIVAINAFNAYAQYSNVENYNTLVNAYNEEFYQYAPDLTEENLLIVEGSEITNEQGKKELPVTFTVSDNDPSHYVYYTGTYTVSESEIAEYKLAIANADTAFEEYRSRVNLSKKSYYADLDKVQANAELWAEIGALKAEMTEGTDEEKTEDAVRNYFRTQAQFAVKESYETVVSKKTKFLWIKNIWATDASYKHPVLSYSSFKSEAKQEKFKVDGSKVSFGNISNYTDAYKEDSYKEITQELSAYKKSANGYYILIALSIGTILLQQFVSMRSQKEQQQYQTVDGQSASQQKIMMVVMTGMFAIFSFMYSSAFSIYLVTSNLFSMISTLIINAFVDKSAEKKEASAAEKRFTNSAAERIEAAKNAGKASADKSRNKNK